MPKATSLTPDALRPAGVTPAAATTPRAPSATARPASVKTMPLQIRLPREEVKAIKVAAAEAEQTISDFMLACFHAHMQARKQS
jgi:hypothetical protein